MSNFILGKKLNMTQIFDDNGNVVPVTVVSAGPVKVLQVKKTDGPDKYNSVQLGYGSKKKVNKAQAGHMKDLGKFQYISEFRVNGENEYKVGDEINVGEFSIGDLVNVQGKSKGRGFAGAIKRHGFSRGPQSHGHPHPRAVGSIGSAFPQHVTKGKKMAGHMGDATVTVKNLEVIEVDKDKNLLVVKGAVPGAPGSLLKIKVSKSAPEPKVKEEA